MNRKTDRKPGASRSKVSRDAVFVLTRAQARELDRLAQKRLAMPSLLLMENAGISAANAALSIRWGAGPGCLIFCGPGNNGGDGMVMARHLFNSGYDVAIAMAADPRRLSGDAAIQHRIVTALGIRSARVEPGMGLERLIRRLKLEPGLAVDALLGTGATGEPREPITTAVRLIDSLRTDGAVVLSLDIPTGMDADTGSTGPSTVCADATVTFAALKPCFLNRRACRWAGRVFIGGIGVPESLVARVGARVSRRRLTRVGYG
jgi:NAD(P)H-hydrate epimerase